MYENNDLLFLIDSEDTMHFYDNEREKNMSLMGEISIAKQENKGTVAKIIYDIVEKKTNNYEAALRAYLGALL